MMMRKTTSLNSLLQGNSQPDRSFYGLGIAPKILDILAHIRFKIPTPIQFKAIPLAIEGKDVIGVAQTGTGKTHAFAIPMVQRIGRTARAGSRGHAISFATPDQNRDVQGIERLIRLTLPVSKHPELPPEEFVKPGHEAPRRNLKRYRTHRSYKPRRF